MKPIIIIIAALIALTAAPALAAPVKLEFGVCGRMKATDTLYLNGRRQHAERFIQCGIGHWPNVDDEFFQAPNGYMIRK